MRIRNQGGNGSPSYLDSQGRPDIKPFSIPPPFSDTDVDPGGGQVLAIQYVSATGDPTTDDYAVCVGLRLPRNVAGDRVYVANPLGDIPSPYVGSRVQAYDTRTGALREVLSPGKEVGYRSGSLERLGSAITRRLRASTCVYAW